MKVAAVMVVVVAIRADAIHKVCVINREFNVRLNSLFNFVCPVIEQSSPMHYDGGMGMGMDEKPNEDRPERRLVC